MGHPLASRCLFVFLVLAALCESWSLPWSVLLSTPVAVFGALAALWIAPRCARLVSAAVHGSDGERRIHPDWSSDAQSGLGAKNSILIVAFAKEEYERGRPLVEAALDGARLRFRALMMTALAFICRVRATLDSVRSRHHRAPDYRYDDDQRRVAETFIGRFFVPAIFYVVEKFSGAKQVSATQFRSAEASGEAD